MADKDVFLHITDSHVRLTAPESRVEEDFLDVALGKFSFIFSLAQSKNATAILHSGDLFDRPDSSAKLLSRMISFFKDNCPCPFIVTPGNHDSFGQHSHSYDETSLGVLEKAECVKVLSEGRFIDFSHSRVLGFGWADKVTQELLDGSYNPKGNTDDLPAEFLYFIGLIHARVGPIGFEFARPIDQTNIHGLDLALFGDIHSGFDEHKVNSTYALSVGSMVRMKSNETHTPSFLMVEVTAKGCKKKKFPIPSQPHESVFVEKITDKMNSDGFIEYVREARNYSGETIEEFVYRLCQKYQFSEETGRIVLEALKGANV